MPDEFNEETNEEEQIVDDEAIIRNKVEERVTKLSNKVKTTSEERDALAIEKANLEKERDFYASFTDSTAKYPGAHEYKDAIKEKVMAGYSVEDATVSILAREGKFQNQASPVEKERELVAGGSALNQIPDGGTKSIGEMTRDEKRQALMEADKRGEIEPILRRGFN